MPDHPGQTDRRTLQRLALAEWPEAASARVDSVHVVGDRAVVVLLLGPDYEYSVYVKRDRHGWHEAGSSSGRADWIGDGAGRPDA